MTSDSVTETERPRRQAGETDPDWYRRCDAYLDEVHPKRVKQRVERAALFRSLNVPTEPEAVIARVRELLALDRAEWVEGHEREWDVLSAAYREHAAAERRARR